jgi:hypothetical protein
MEEIALNVNGNECQNHYSDRDIFLANRAAKDATQVRGRQYLFACLMLTAFLVALFHNYYCQHSRSS